MFFKPFNNLHSIFRILNKLKKTVEDPQLHSNLKQFADELLLFKRKESTQELRQLLVNTLVCNSLSIGVLCSCFHRQRPQTRKSRNTVIKVVD
jgi:hypothetical protein